MKISGLIIVSLLLIPQLVVAEKDEPRRVSSPENRVALLELYTSEGCSSCPPADAWLSQLRKAGIDRQQLIPLAFHVTYWDYIGWQDRFAAKRYDERQRTLGRVNQLSTIYTPQFVLDGKDFRRYDSFTADVFAITKQKSTVDLQLGLSDRTGDNAEIELRADISDSKSEKVALFLAVVENDLLTEVEDGENEGETLHHDYVVRRLYGPHFVHKPENRSMMKQLLTLQQDWKQDDVSLVGFAQNLNTGEVLQAVTMPLLP